METSPDPAAAPSRASGSDPDPATSTARATRLDPARTTRPDPALGAGPPNPEPAAEPAHGHHRRTLLVSLGVIAAGSAAALVAGLVSWAPDPPEPPRTLTVEESERLAAMRVTNYRDGRAALRATFGTGVARTELVGWVDWTLPLIYLNICGPGAGPSRGLVQATPGVVLSRPDSTAVPTAAPPPLVPPADGWRIRDLPDRSPLASALDLLFALSTDRPAAGALHAGGARWVARATAGGVPVDVLQAPAAPIGTTPDRSVAPAPARSGRAPGSAGAPGASAPIELDGQPRYWVDRNARLHRLEARLPGAVPISVELDRTSRPALRPVNALGGRPGLPRALTAGEADRLSRLPARMRARGGAALTLTAPTVPAGNLRGNGWINWARQATYLAVGDLDAPGRRTLLRYDGGGGVAQAQVPAEAVTGDGDPPGRPPLPPPTEYPWRYERAGAGDLDLLVNSALRLDGRSEPGGRAMRLREDRLADRIVDVIEVRTSRARLRYWVDRSGLLRRLELRTSAGAYAQLDLTPGPVPALPRVTTARSSR